jgi:hypothetical protein
MDTIDFTIAPPLGANAAGFLLNAPAPWGANVKGSLKSSPRATWGMSAPTVCQYRKSGCTSSIRPTTSRRSWNPLAWGVFQPPRSKGNFKHQKIERVLFMEVELIKQVRRDLKNDENWPDTFGTREMKAVIAIHRELLLKELPQDFINEHFGKMHLNAILLKYFNRNRLYEALRKHRKCKKTAAGEKLLKQLREK